MPIDPEKFKKVVTNHFENLTEEEFLKTLKKSSPHLFDENLDRKESVSFFSHINAQNRSKQIDRLALGKRLKKIASFLSVIVFSLSLCLLLRNSFNIEPSSLLHNIFSGKSNPSPDTHNIKNK